MARYGAPDGADQTPGARQAATVALLSVYIPYQTAEKKYNRLLLWKA
jgi:hypothetical protein